MRTTGAIDATSAVWDDAFARVESYLRAHHIHSRVKLTELTTDILASARELAARHPTESPVTLAMQVAQARVGQWLALALNREDWTDQHLQAKSRLAVLLTEVPTRHADLFLTSASIPAELKKRLASVELQQNPELRFSNMPPSTLEFAFTEAVEEKWSTFSRSTFVRASFSWAAILSAAGLTWLVTR